jgi:hypothetical protein
VAYRRTFDARKNSTSSCRRRGNVAIAETMFQMIESRLLCQEAQ